MPTYETLFITPPNLAEDEERAAVEALSQIVSDGGGAFFANERWGRRRLAYPIGKFDDGVYVRFLYDSEAAVSRELDRRIRLSDKVLRSLTVRLDPDWAVAAKEDAKREAERRAAEAAEAEARAAAGEETPPPAPVRDEPPSDDDSADPGDGRSERS